MLRGGIGQGRFVNCVDCANLVVTFANVLDYELWPSEMGANDRKPFELNPILAIGASQWKTPCDWEGFSYHVVGWKGDCEEDDEVFDACGFSVPDGDYETLAGFVLERLGRIPEVGEGFEHDGWQLEVIELDGHRVATVRLLRVHS